MKQREFFLGLKDNGQPLEAMKKMPNKHTYYQLIRVREVSPELDAAYEKCEGALEFISKNYNAFSEELMNTITLKENRNEARKALAALKKAKGE